MSDGLNGRGNMERHSEILLLDSEKKFICCANELLLLKSITKGSLSCIIESTIFKGEVKHETI